MINNEKFNGDQEPSNTRANELARMGFRIMIAGPLILALAGVLTKLFGYFPEFIGTIISWVAIPLPAIGAIYCFFALRSKEKPDQSRRSLCIVTLIMCNPFFYLIYFFICTIAGESLAGLSWM